jgi:glycosyltransferase involved in cell wall biosynthesis
MRVCFVITNTFALNAFLASPIDGLAAAGWEITVALNTADGEIAESIRRHAEVVDLGMRREISPIADLPVLARLWRLMRARRFDVVHSITPKAGALAMTASLLARVPVRMHTFTGQVWVTRQGLMRRFLQCMESYVAGCATHVLADSPSQREFMVSHGIVPADKLEVLAEGSICGVDIQRFRPRPDVRVARRRKLGIPEDAIVLLYVGRLHPDKGLGELGCAFERLAARNPRVHLLLVGPDESGLAHVHDGVVHARSRVHAVGRTTEPELYMAAADVFCLPSYREGFGMSLLEAAACGVPAVASRIYGITDAVQENVTGLLVPPRDADALAEALERIIQDAPLRARLGAAARERAARLFAKDVLQQAWLGLYERQQHVEQAEEVRPRPGNA